MTTAAANSCSAMGRETILKSRVSSRKTIGVGINSKSVLTTLFLLFCVANGSFATKVVATYSLSYFEKQYDIEASEIKNGKFSVYIQVNADEMSTRAMINVESADLEEFVRFLLQMKVKYVEWSEVAKANNITDMSKEMDIKSPSTTICWQGSKWFFSFGHKLQPRFLILDSGKMVVSIYKKVTASSNQYIDEKIYWVFSDPKEIDELVYQLDAEKIKEKLLKEENASDLFK